MCELSVDFPEVFPSQNSLYTLPRVNMGESALKKSDPVPAKSATISRIENPMPASCDFAKLHRRSSLRNLSSLFGRVVRTVTTLPRDRNSRKYGLHEADTGEIFVQYAEDQVPGVVGLANHGNTCFINAVVQCLSNTDTLAEYLVCGQYKVDLCHRRRANAKKYGTRGEITEQLAATLRAIWSRQYTADVSVQLKACIEKFAKHFRGSDQHDAQEFLMWLLDKVHEDLNTATKRKYKMTKSSQDSRCDELVAAESLANHQRCNASIVQDIFQAQFRSSLRCPSCCRESNTFDPFLCISVPVVQRQRRHLLINVVYINQQPRLVRMCFSVASDSNVYNVREQVSRDTGLPLSHCLLCQLNQTGFMKPLLDTDVVSSLAVEPSCVDTDDMMAGSEQLYCVEMPSVSPLDDTILPTPTVTLLWTNLCRHADSDDRLRRFGSPYLMQVPCDVLYEDLQKLMLKEMSTIVKPSVLGSVQKVPLFKIQLAGSGICLDSGESRPLISAEFVSDCASASGGDMTGVQCAHVSSSMQHVTLHLLWSTSDVDSMLVSTEEHMEVHRSVREMAAQSMCAVTLEECLQLYTKTEQLGPEDSWRCSSCHSNQQAEKRLSLWSVPDILVVHLKRFRQTNNQQTMSKLTTRVDFPVHNLDMQFHLACRDTSNSHTSSTNTMAGVSGGGLAARAVARVPLWPSWRRHQRVPGATSSITTSAAHNNVSYTGSGSTATVRNMYQLYAVCCHHGRDMLSGHYTALCRNSVDGQWYKYDDTRVSVVSEQEIVTSDAYLLFYHRNSSHPCYDAVGGRNHWAYRIRRVCASLSAANSSSSTAGYQAPADRRPAGTESSVTRDSSCTPPVSTSSNTEEEQKPCDCADKQDNERARSREEQSCLVKPAITSACVQHMYKSCNIQSESDGQKRGGDMKDTTVGVSVCVSDHPATQNSYHNDRDNHATDDLTPIKPQVILIGHGSAGGPLLEQSHNFGDNIKIFVGRQTTATTSSSSTDTQEPAISTPSGLLAN